VAAATSRGCCGGNANTNASFAISRRRPADGNFISTAMMRSTNRALANWATADRQAVAAINKLVVGEITVLPCIGHSLRYSTDNRAGIGQ